MHVRVALDCQNTLTIGAFLNTPIVNKRFTPSSREHFSRQNPPQKKKKRTMGGKMCWEMVLQKDDNIVSSSKSLPQHSRGQPVHRLNKFVSR